MELAIYDAFRKAGVEEEAAKAITTAINKAIEYNVDSKQLATKGDIEKLRLETKADIEKAKADIIKWMFGAIITAVGLATGIAMAIARLFLTAA